MTKLNEKRIYVDALTSARGAIAELNDSNLTESEYLTYLTSSAYIVGKQIKLIDLNFESEEGLLDSLHTAFDNNDGTIDPLSVANAFYNEYIKQYKENGIEIYDEDKVVMLADVTLIPLHTNTPVKLGYFVLFTDNIIGIIPGKLESQQR